MKKAEIRYHKKVDLSVAEIKDVFRDRFVPGERVVIKIHFGEPGNKHAFTPEVVKPYILALSELGFEMVLWDCPVFYSSPRDTKEGYEKVIRDKGFPEICECEICDEYVSVELPSGGTAEVAKIMVEAKNLLVLTHVKGHGMAGFGGAIKNIGIGAMSPKTKGWVHEMKSARDKWGFSQERLGEVVATAVTKMPDNRVFVNILREVSKLCDCVGRKDNPIVAPDLGVLVSDDIVAVDQASLDMINVVKKDVFVRENGVDPQAHIDSTAKYSGLTRGYDLK